MSISYGFSSLPKLHIVSVLARELYSHSDSIAPDNPLELQKVEQDREIAEEQQQEFDTNNLNLLDIDSVKKRINEETGTNKTILARDPRVRKQIVSREGGTSATEAAVARGLA
jgi:hypothetical protein